MFDDPNKALKNLQEQLMAAEEGGEPLPAAPQPEAPVKKYTSTKKPPAENQNKAALLVALLLLELAALLAVLAWWLLW